jgi:hypothetical protein
MFLDLFIIIVCIPLHLYWVVQVVRLLREQGGANPRPPRASLWMLGFAAQS